MKKVSLIIITLILLLSFVSCDKQYHDTEQSRFVVTEIMERKGMSKMTSYNVLMLDTSGVGTIDFWVVDSVGKYNVGDILILQPFK